MKDISEKESGPVEKTFEEMLAETQGGYVRFRPGEKIEAKVVGISEEWIFIDLGGKTEGVLSRDEFLDDSGALTLAEGETINAYFLFTRNNEFVFTTNIDSDEAGRTYLEEAWESGGSIEGLVEKEIKGGYEVKIAGGLRAFCPHSQMGLRGKNEPENFIGEELTFKISEFSERGNNVVLSNRAILEAELEGQRQELRESLKEGMRITGTITSLQKFGAFIDIGGIQGLIPISEIAWGRIEDIKDVLSVGQEVEVAIKKLDWEKDRLSFSIKDTLENPWQKVYANYPEGSRHKGKIVKLMKFGAFLELEGGIDGLLHISSLGAGKRINHPSEVVQVGQEMDVQVEKVDVEQRRISLVPAGFADAKKESTQDDFSEFLGKSSESMGTLGDLLRRKMKERKK